MAFYTVSTGATIQAADVSQFANVLNGTTNGAIIVPNAPGTPPIIGQFATAPGVDASLVGGWISGDTVLRLSLYVRGADGYGGIAGGAGTSTLAHLYVQSYGWRIPEALHVDGVFQCDNGNIVSNGAGALSVASFGASAAASANQLRATYAGGSYLDGSAQFSGTGSGTYTHGLSRGPNYVGVIQNVANSTTTVGVDSIGSTTCHININGSYAFLAWCCLD